MTPLQSIDLPIELSADGTTSWKTLVCLENYDAPFDTQTTDTNTFCGIAKGQGPIKFGPKGTAVFDSSNPTGTVGLTQMRAWQVARTQIFYRLQNPESGSAGSVLYESGQCVVVSTALKAAAGDVIHFDFELGGIGDPDVTP